MRLSRALSIVFLLSSSALATNTSVVSIPPPELILRTLREVHPRLLVGPEDFARIRRLVEEDERASGWYSRLKAEANEILETPASTYVIPDGLRLLRTSRTVLRRVYTLGLLYRLGEGDRPYLERLWQEVEAAANFPDWNPRHFLDTAEMSHALAIAYDWLYDSWSERQKQVLREAIVRHGLLPARAAYQGKADYGWWTSVGHNWNQVCNGGIGVAALAIAEENPELVSEVLHEALIRIPEAMVHYGPDGGWNEGPGYWHYATSYNVYLLAALESALGTDFGLAKIEGFSEAGSFPIFMTGPTGRTFNFADGGEGTIRAPEMFWLARKFQRPEYAAYQAQHTQGTALDLIWFDPAMVEQDIMDRTLDAYYRGLEVVTMRSSWTDPDAFFVGFKAGDNKANHSNLDVGTFVLEALGQRWAVDLGADNYNLPRYFDADVEGTRWTYYRMRAEGHNTIVINPALGPDQNPLGEASISCFFTEPEQAWALADLSSAYTSNPPVVHRRITLIRDSSPRVVVEDLVRTGAPSAVWWFLHTPAQIRLEEKGQRAVLTLGGSELVVELASSPEAQFIVMDARPLSSSPDPDGQSKNEGIRKLAIELGGVSEATIKVLVQSR